MTQVKDFGVLGSEFQLKVLSQIICDKTFGLNIINIIEPTYFDNQHFRNIVVSIKNFYNKFNHSLPTISGLKESIVIDIKDSIQKEYLLSIINGLPDKALEDVESTQDKALKFCRQQAVKKFFDKGQDIYNRGNFEEYDLLEGLLKDALAVGENQDDSIELDSDIDEVLKEDYRNPISTGIPGLDYELDGGIARGELSILLMPSGIGKSTMLTKFANAGLDQGLNVLHVYFEDKHKAIQRKHYTCASGIPMNQIHTAKEYVKEKVAEQMAKGNLKLKRLKLGTTVPNIRQYIQNRLNKGIKTDMLVLDYIDCLSPGKVSEDKNGNEEMIVRQLESLADEFDLVLHAACQTNRTGSSSEVVTADQIQGSYKRVQVAHCLMSVNKTPQQKELGLANLAILKTRFGGKGDGKVFENMTFNNKTMEFNTEPNSLVSIASYEMNKETKKEEQQTKNASEAYEKYKQQKAKLAAETI